MPVFNVPAFFINSVSIFQTIHNFKSIIILMNWIKKIESLLAIQNHKKLGFAVLALCQELDELKDKRIKPAEESDITVKKNQLLRDLQQIYESQTIERAHHYCAQLIKGLSSTKYRNYNDINLNRWKEYDDIETDRSRH